MDMIATLICIALGALGGGGYLMLGVYKNGIDWLWQDKKKFLHIGLGAIAAFVALLAGLPNHFNSFLVGWLAPVFLETLMQGTERRTEAKIKNKKK